MHRLQPVLGLIVMIGLLVAFSSNRRAIRWRIVAWGLGLQVLFALLVLKVQAGETVFSWINTGFLKIVDATEAGSTFVFGPMAKSDYVPVGRVGSDSPFSQREGLVAQTGFSFAFRVLPTIIFFSSLMAMGYHLGIMQLVVRAFAKVMAVSMKTSGAETLSASANIFVGQTEAPLMVRPYVNTMTRSELMAVMVGGFATVAGGVMLAYIIMLRHLMPDIGTHLLTASVMSAPASLMMAKLAVPETETPRTLGDVRVELPRSDANLLDAASRGATEGLTLALNVGAMLLVFVGLLALADMALAAIGTHVFGVKADGPQWSLALLFGRAFAPLAWLLGVPSEDCAGVGRLLGTKTFLNEFVAYADLSKMPELSPRARLIASYALCGFANFSSIGIQIGGIGGMAPERRHDLARLGLKAMIVGSFAAFSTACVVAILTADEDLVIS